MQLIKTKGTWDPFAELEDLSHRFQKLLGRTRWTNGEGELLAESTWMPSCDVSESDTEYRICAELPQVKKEDVHVTLENGVLTIQGERREEKEEKKRRFHRREMSYGSFVRRFTVPDDADAAKVDAAFKDGVLNVTLQKSKAKAKAHEVAVR